jgi:predicted acetyltransferase
MTDENLTLVEASPDYADDFQAMAREYVAQGPMRETPGYQEALKDIPAAIGKMRDMTRGANLAEGLVPQTTYWLVRDSRTIVAVARLRHRLTPSLEIEGGHIGYSVRPSERRKGYGTIICALALRKARDMGLARVLLTCDVGNAASARIIEKNGGTFDGVAYVEKTGKRVSRYWIDL